jgi:periplasmic copper chaperone A
MRKFALALSIVLATAGVAQGEEDGGIEILEAHAPAMTDAKTIHVPVYMTIRNRGRSDERLLAASTSYAEKVELVEPRREMGQTLPMATEALRVASGATLELNAHGPRLLLLGLKQPLHAPQRFAMTLFFERSGPIEIEVVAIDALSAARPHRH